MAGVYTFASGSSSRLCVYKNNFTADNGSRKQTFALTVLFLMAISYQFVRFVKKSEEEKSDG